MSAAVANILACNRCPKRQPPPYSGPCACTVDGRDIMDHAEAGDCPLGRFEGATAPTPCEPAEPAKPAKAAKRPAVAMCARCHSPAHDVSACPIPPDYEASPRNATAGGCGCGGGQTADVHRPK